MYSEDGDKGTELGICARLEDTSPMSFRLGRIG